jgi:hypothetical protein
MRDRPFLLKTVEDVSTVTKNRLPFTYKMVMFTLIIKQ